MSNNGSFLLDHGDELQLSETVTLVYQAYGTVKQTGLTATQEREKSILSSRYLITRRLLGEGAYGKVLIGVDQTTQRQLACKMVNLESHYDRRAELSQPTDEGQPSCSQAIKQLPPRVQKCFREFDILKKVSHPNVVQVQKVFWSRSTIYIFQELVTGGDLFSYIENRHGRISSIESAVIIRQVLKGVQYLHDHDIVHRDLKPDNILMTSLDNGARVVITDFGHARFLPEANIQRHYASNKLQRMFSVVGTAEYAAPEIYRVNEAVPKAWGYSLAVDLWAIGSITAAILTGQLLFSCRRDGSFEEDAERVIIGLAAECDLSILDDEHHPTWGAIASSPKDFIKRLLVLNEEKRMSACEALNHVWFTHPMMAADFEAQYERSIKNWHPRQKDEQLIEQIKRPAVARQPSKGEPFGHMQSHFFPPTYLPTQAAPASMNQHVSHGFVVYQFASHPDPAFYDDSFLNSDAHPFDNAAEYTRSGETCDEGLDVNSDRRLTNVQNVTDDRLTPQIQDRGAAKRAATGQLHRVSTTTRCKYFRREIVDLDDLDASSGAPRKSMELDESNTAKAELSAQRETLRQEETVQVRTTPSAEENSTDGVELWWHHRYPLTQHHYDTQAEPFAEDGDEVLVQETPPEVCSRPSSPSKGNAGDSLEYRGKHPRVFEASKVSKQKKVYGRQP